jgi:hypothetical protein
MNMRPRLGIARGLLAIGGKRNAIFEVKSRPRYSLQRGAIMKKMIPTMRRDRSHAGLWGNCANAFFLRLWSLRAVIL